MQRLRRVGERVPVEQLPHVRRRHRRGINVRAAGKEALGDEQGRNRRAAEFGWPHGCSLRNAKIAPRRTRLNRMRPHRLGSLPLPKTRTRQGPPTMTATRARAPLRSQRTDKTQQHHRAKSPLRRRAAGWRLRVWRLCWWGLRSMWASARRRHSASSRYRHLPLG